jgi:hypothetical protein
MKRATLPAILAMTVLATAGCGYRTAGKGAALPPDLHTIAIPTFINVTSAYRAEQVLTQAVVHEFNSRTNYHVVHSTGTGEADATLSGTVTSVRISPLTYDSVTGRMSSGMVTVSMRVALTRSSGKVLYQNSNYSFHQQYEVSREASSFFQEASPALDRLSRDFARTLVSDILEDY